MHRLDQLPLVVRLPLENDLSWIVLADEIYRACLCRIIGWIETRARFRSLLNTETGEGELAARQHACELYTFWGLFYLSPRRFWWNSEWTISSGFNFLADYLIFEIPVFVSFGFEICVSWINLIGWLFAVDRFKKVKYFDLQIYGKWFSRISIKFMHV